MSEGVNRYASAAIRCLLEGLDQKIKTLDRIVQSEGKVSEGSPNLQMKRQSDAFNRGLVCLRDAMDIYDKHLIRRDLVEDIEEYF